MCGDRQGGRADRHGPDVALPSLARRELRQAGAGEQEHGVALLTTVLRSPMREAVGGGRMRISSLTKRGPIGGFGWQMPRGYPEIV